MTLDWWTLGIQAANVAILVWLLGRFFWRPVAAMIAERQAGAGRIMAEAEERHRQAEDALAGIERTRAGFETERTAILTAAQAAAERAGAAVLEAARQEAAALEAASRAAMAKEREAEQALWTGRARALAVEIAGRLAARLDGAAVRASFLEWLLRALHALPEATRSAMDGAALDVASAAPIAPEEQEEYRRRIGEALGASPLLSFTVDPALIAGLELRGPHLVVGNSWRADLDHILAELANDGRT